MADKGFPDSSFLHYLAKGGKCGDGIEVDGSKVGFFGKTPVVQQPANPDTSGATLAALETEVNEIKAALRAVGLIA